MPKPIGRIHLTSDFQKAFRKIPTRIQDLTEKKNRWFRLDAFDKRLHTHRLRGELEGFWSYWVNYQYRILFRFLKEDEVIYYDIGTHEVYR